jgi:hypothetical protein
LDMSYVPLAHATMVHSPSACLWSPHSLVKNPRGRTHPHRLLLRIHTCPLARSRTTLVNDIFLHTNIPFCHVYIFYSSPYHPRSTTLSIRWQFSTHLQLKTPLQYHHHRHTHATPLFTQLRTPTIPSTYYRFLWVCVAFTPCHPFIVL